MGARGDQVAGTPSRVPRCQLSAPRVLVLSWACLLGSLAFARILAWLGFGLIMVGFGWIWLGLALAGFGLILLRFYIGF